MMVLASPQVVNQGWTMVGIVMETLTSTFQVVAEGSIATTAWASTTLIGTVSALAL